MKTVFAHRRLRVRLLQLALEPGVPDDETEIAERVSAHVVGFNMLVCRRSVAVNQGLQSRVRKAILCYSVDMKMVPVAVLRQNPTRVLAEVEGGATYIVTRHNREIARLVPPVPAATVTPEQFRELLGSTPLTGDWAGELKEAAADFAGDDPWLDNP